MKRSLLNSLIALIALLSANIVNAQNAHFNKNSPPDVDDEGTTLCLSGTLHGLGNYAGQQVNARLETTGIATTECRNPAGNVAPGQSGEVTSATPNVPLTVDRQGRLRITNLCTQSPSVTSQQAGCPNPRWTASVTDVQFTSAVLIIGDQRIDVSQYIQ